jgi:hypothetical protein
LVGLLIYCFWCGLGSIGRIANGGKESGLKGIGACEDIFIGHDDRTFVGLTLEIAAWLVLN